MVNIGRGPWQARTTTVIAGYSTQMSLEDYKPARSGSFIRVSGTKLVNDAGEEVVLRGAGLGGWMT